MVTLDKNKKMMQGSGKTVFDELKINDFSPFLSLKSLKTHLCYVNIDPLHNFKFVCLFPGD